MASALYGTVFGALFGGWPADRLGRRATLLWHWRALSGVSAVGSGLRHGCLFVHRARASSAAWASAFPRWWRRFTFRKSRRPSYRGRLAGMFQFNIVFGILVAYLSNALLAGIGRERLALDAGGGRVSLPALHRVSASACRKVRAGCSSRKDDRRGGLAVLRDPARRLGRPSWRPRRTKSPPPRRSDTRRTSFWTWRLRIPILLAVLIAFFNQLSGINAILYFAPRIFELTGLGAKAALLQSVGIGVTNLIFTFVGSVADRPAGPAHAALHRLVRLHRFAGPVAWAFFTAAFRHRAGVHLRLHRGACGRPGRGDLGVHLGNFPEPPSGGRPGAGQLHALDLRGAAHDASSRRWLPPFRRVMCSRSFAA